MNAGQRILDNGLTLSRRDPILVITGMVILSVLAWLYLLIASRSTHAMDHAVAMPQSTSWSLPLLALGILMWTVMMIAMMLPTAMPMVLSYLRVQRQRQPEQQAQKLTWLLIGGYLLAWTLFSVLAALAGWALHGLGLLSAPMGSAAPSLTGAFLLAAGVFQWSGVKEACLTKCRSPLNFLLNNWRQGSGGALLMGLQQGVFCVACCWLLMLLMLVGGVMNLAWMAAIAIYVLAEKIAPRIRLLSRLTGVGLVAAGVMWMGLALAG